MTFSKGALLLKILFNNSMEIDLAWLIEFFLNEKLFISKKVEKNRL